VAEIGAAVADPAVRLVLITGEAGVGKSHLLDAVAALLGGDRAWGVRALAEIPLSSLAHLVPPSDSLTALTRALLLGVGDVLHVDDLDQCDPLSLALLHRLSREPGRTIVATVRTESGRVPDVVADFANDPATRTFDVPAFTREEARDLLESVLGGDVDADLDEAVWQRTRGNALYAIQLARAARMDGAIEEHNGAWVRVGSLPVPPSLRRALVDRIAALDEGDRETVEFLAGLGRIPVSRVTASKRTDAVRRLAAAGIVAVSDAPTPIVGFTHPLFGEAIWEDLDPLRRHAVLREHFEWERRASDPDLVRVAVLGLEVGAEVAPTALLQAARLASGGGDFAITARLAEAALPRMRGDDRIETIALLTEAQVQYGRLDDAVATMEKALAETRPGRGSILLAGLYHGILLWGLHDEAAATHMLVTQAKRYPRGTPLLKEIFGILEAEGLAYAGRSLEALAVTERIQPRGGLWWKLTGLGRLGPQVVARIAQSRARALIELGRSGEAVRILSEDDIQARLIELEETIPGWRGGYHSALSHALREDGRPREAVDHALTAVDATHDSGLVRASAWASCQVAASWLFVGDLALASEWAERSFEQAGAVGLVDCERLAINIASGADGARGIPARPEYLRRLAELPDGVGYLRQRMVVGEAWRAFADGRREEARGILVAGAERAQEDGAFTSLAFVLHELLRMGGGPGIAEQLAALPHGSGLVTARLLLARGMEASDAELLTRAADAFEAGGMPLFAAEAAAQAAQHADGRTGSALRQRAARLAAEVGSPVTPLLAAAPPADVLTRREREIAELATRLPSADIATRLHLSVRTVENHLAKAYAKLGITTRGDLGDALGVRA
jgi:DNA-binding CsgD family transcriptional regulator